MKALLSIILVTILQIPIISGIFHTIEDNHDHYVCEDQRLHLHELSYECEICFLTNATFVYHSDISETNSLVFDKLYIANLNELSENSDISTKSSRAPPVRV